MGIVPYASTYTLKKNIGANLFMYIFPYVRFAVMEPAISVDSVTNFSVPYSQNWTEKILSPKQIVTQPSQQHQYNVNVYPPSKY